MRNKSTDKDLPPRMLRRKKRLASGKVWVGYYYNGRDESGQRREIPLGPDLSAAKRKWAELECKPAPLDAGVMSEIFGRYIRDVIPGKAARTQIDNLGEMKMLRAVFDSAPIDAITPAHIAQYRDKRGVTAKTRANREIALLSHVINMAREWGYTSRENPCRGVKRHREAPRDYYADAEVWSAVYAQACDELRDAMDLAYLTGQRPADVIKMRMTDISQGALLVQQGKTGKKLRILLAHAESGQQTALGALIDRVRARPRNVASLYIIATPAGAPLTRYTLRVRFDAARSAAAQAAPEIGDRIMQFQFRDIRPKAASEIELPHAQALLGHSRERITEEVYRRVGATVMPAK